MSNFTQMSKDEIKAITEENYNTMLSSASEKQKYFVENNTPPVHKYKTLVAYTSNSRTSAIDVKCLQCSNFQRDEVINCKVESCGLYKFRPYQPKDCQ